MGYIVSNRRMSVDEELQRMWKEVVVTYFKRVHQNLSERSKENYNKSVRVACLQAGNLTWNLSSMMEEC
jgi:hypothetical protein